MNFKIIQSTHSLKDTLKRQRHLAKTETYRVGSYRSSVILFKFDSLYKTGVSLMGHLELVPASLQEYALQDEHFTETRTDMYTVKPKTETP